MLGAVAGIVLPNIAINVADSAASQAGYVLGASAATVGPSPMVGNPAVPTFRSSVTVWNPAWILVVIAGIWLIASKGGRQ